MLKQHSILEIVKGDRVYQLHLPSDSPLGEVHDVIFQMRAFVLQKLQESLAADQPQEPPQDSGKNE